MYRSSFPIGRYFGVDLRIHASLPALLALPILYSAYHSGSIVRGLGLCFALLFAIAVREAARTLAAAYSGLHLRLLLIFPVGGVMAFAAAGDTLESSTRLVTLVTPVANILAGLIILGISYGIDPGVQLFAQPWISAEHVLRSIVWTQFVLGAVSFVPVATLVSRNLPLPRAAAPRPLPGLNLGSILAFGCIVAGFSVGHLWLALFGILVLLTTLLRGSAQGSLSPTNSMLVREAMQTDFTLISSSETLRSALQQTLSSGQDIFPVVRGDRLVGSVARDTLTAHLQAEGDSYVQGAMTRNLLLALPDESLVQALRRSASSSSGELIAVVEGGMLAGILTQAGVVRTMHRASVLPAVRDEED